MWNGLLQPRTSDFDVIASHSILLLWRRLLLHVAIAGNATRRRRLLLLWRTWWLLHEIVEFLWRHLWAKSGSRSCQSVVLVAVDVLENVVNFPLRDQIPWTVANCYALRGSDDSTRCPC